MMETMGVLDGISFNALCAVEFGQHTGVPFATLRDRLLAKLQVDHLEQLDPSYRERASTGELTHKSELDTPRGRKGSGGKNSVSIRPGFIDLFTRNVTEKTEGGRVRRTSGSGGSESRALGLVRTGSLVVREKSVAVESRFGAWKPRMMLGPNHEGWENALGFFVLEEMAGLVGYRGHLRARSRLSGSFEIPTFTDLMMWAVLLGNQELARALWRRCLNPLRAAIAASRLCLKLRDTWGGAIREELQAAADEYEAWAIGTLDQIPAANAMDILTNVPVRHVVIAGQKEPKLVKLWPGSVIDVAMGTPFPCRKFLAHPHCQRVFGSYMLGNYRGSLAAVPEGTSLIRVCLQSLLHVVLLPCPGASKSLSFVDVHEPLFSPLQMSTFEREGLQGDTAPQDEHDELDEDYWHDPADCQLASDQRHRGTLKAWVAYWNIPLVKLVLHFIAAKVTIILLILVLYENSSWDNIKLRYALRIYFNGTRHDR
jgi:hypothetical protein